MPEPIIPEREADEGHTRSVTPTIVPAVPGWEVVRGPYATDGIPVVAWSVADSGVLPVTIYGKEKQPVAMHYRDVVYHPGGQRERWSDYEQHMLFGASSLTSAGRRGQ